MLESNCHLHISIPGCRQGLQCADNRQIRCFIKKMLLFVAWGSAPHLNRVAGLLWAMGCHLLVHRANCFEDYALPKGAMEVLTMRAVKALMRLLGLLLAEDKINPFAAVAEMLGVEIDLRHATALLKCRTRSLASWKCHGPLRTFRPQGGLSARLFHLCWVIFSLWTWIAKGVATIIVS